MNNPKKIIVHHTAVSRKVQPRQFLAINRYHRDAKDGEGNWRFHYGKPTSMGYYGGYQLLIEPDGSEWRYRRDNEVGAHTKGQNDTSLAVALAGNFHHELPTEAQMKTLRARLKKWSIKYAISTVEIKPHRIYANTTCYGSLLSDSWAASLTKPKPAITSRETEVKKMSNRLDTIRQLLLRLSILIARLKKGRR